MASDVPPEFDKPWSLLDVVIRTNNSDGKEIHAYKGALAMFSPYFRALFFGNFKERNDASVEMEILKHIYRIGYKSIKQMQLLSGMLVMMYKTPDFYDFAFIREMFIDHIEGYPSVDMSVVHFFCDEELSDVTFVVGGEVFKSHKMMGVEVPPEFDKPWRLSDVVICAHNSNGKEIHANKGALAMFSPNFHVLFFGDFEEKNDASVNVDCDHDIVVEILRNIHQIGFKSQNPYPSETIVKMYRAAEFYDFPDFRLINYANGSSRRTSTSPTEKDK